MKGEGDIRKREKVGMQQKHGENSLKKMNKKHVELNLTLNFLKT